MGKQHSSKWEHAVDMRSREVIAAQLETMGTKAPAKTLSRMAYATELQAIIEPSRIEPSFATKHEAAIYAREVAKALGGRDCLDPPRVRAMRNDTPRGQKLLAKRIAKLDRPYNVRRKERAKFDAISERVQRNSADSYRERAEGKWPILVKR